MEYALVLTRGGALCALVEQPSGDIPSLEAGDVVLGEAPPLWQVLAIEGGLADKNLCLAPGVEAQFVPGRLWAAWRARLSRRLASPPRA